jgi:hypothetical protein
MLSRSLALLLCATRAHSPDHVLDAGAGVEVHVCEGPSCAAPYTVAVAGKAWLVGGRAAGASQGERDGGLRGLT